MIWERYVKTGVVMVVVAGVIGTGVTMKHYKDLGEHYKDQSVKLAGQVTEVGEKLRNEIDAHKETRRNVTLMAEALSNAELWKKQSTDAAAEDKSKLSTLQKDEPCATTRMPDDAFNVVRQAAINANAASNVRIGRFTTGPESNSGTGSH